MSNDGFAVGLFLFFPLLPIGFDEVVGDLLAEFGDFLMNYAPNDIAIDLKILVYEKVSHVGDAAPIDFGMG